MYTYIYIKIIDLEQIRRTQYAPGYYLLGGVLENQPAIADRRRIWVDYSIMLNMVPVVWTGHRVNTNFPGPVLFVPGVYRSRRRNRKEYHTGGRGNMYFFQVPAEIIKRS